MAEAIILAGGLGTRLKKKLRFKSKTLAFVKKRTLLERIIHECIKYKIFNVHLIINENQKDIIKYLIKKKIKAHIKIYIEKKPLGDGGALSLLKKKNFLLKKNYLVINGDLLININLKKIIRFHKKNNSQLTIVTHPNNHPFDSDILKTNENNRLIKIFNKPHSKKLIYNNNVSSGIVVISGSLIKNISNKKKSFYKEIIPKLLKNNKKIICYKTREFIKDLGTPERLIKGRKIFNTVKFKFSNIKNKLPAIFLDRDGVINKETHKKIEDPTIFFPNTIEAIKKINNSNYLCIVITNQPSIAKGFITKCKLEFLHNKLETKLGKAGAYFDAIYYCPHHPSKGFQNENILYKKICNCRKPKIGMLNKANLDLNINMKKSYFIGNTIVDYQTAKNSKLKYIHIGNNKIFKKRINKFKNLYSAIKSII
jgi:mannose-1-phosphate guanylyltransferase/phosphomannomutase